MFSALHHFCVQTVSNHSAVLQSLGDLSSLIDDCCSVNGVAAVGGAQKVYRKFTACDRLIMHNANCMFIYSKCLYTSYDTGQYFFYHSTKRQIKHCMSVIYCPFYILKCLLWICTNWARSCVESSALQALLVNYHKLGLLFVYHAHLGN